MSEARKSLTFANPGRLLPTLEGKVSGVVWHEPPIVTVQCAVCFQTATGKTIFAVNHANFAPDEEFQRPLDYRRCTDCQKAKRHPRMLDGES